LPPTSIDRSACTIILFAAEHGFVGGYNARLLDALEAAFHPGDTLMILGSRGAALAAERKLEPDWIEPLASRCEGAAETTRRLTAELYRRILGRHSAKVELIYGRCRQGGAPEAVRRTLLPLDMTIFKSKPGKQPPLSNLSSPALVRKLTAEYVFAMLTEAAVESIAGENAARFAAMDSAHENVSKKLDELNDQSREVRQSEITTELIDVVTGAEALLHRS
jgi:F-type H+-transporting ATPase subunit gamma